MKYVITLVDTAPHVVEALKAGSNIWLVDDSGARATQRRYSAVHG